MNCSTPYMPRFEIVNVPPSRSACCSLLVARARDDVGAGGGDLGDREPVGAADHRDDEAALGRDGEPDVGGREELDRVAGEVRVHLAVAHRARPRRPS